MALTEEQSTTLQQTIDNLNRSIEVNAEVLEILRSTGNTGTVDIAQHNTDPSAHENLENVHASVGYNIGSSYTDERAYARLVRSVNSGQTYGNFWFDTYACQGATAHEVGASGFSMRNVYYVNDWSRTFTDGQNFDVTSITARKGFKSEGQGITYSTSHTLVFQIREGKNSAFIGVANSSSSGNYQFYFEERCYRPYGNIDLGSSTYQWKDCYLRNSPIVSSDERLKQDIEEIPEAVFRAWSRVNFKQYRFKEAVTTKGNSARKHVGVIAQQILAAFEAEGLDATAYGIVCHDSWTDQYQYETVTDAEAVLDAEGKVLVPEKTHQEKRFVKAAGDVWTVRYEEALALETAYQRWRLSKIEAALQAKGITL